MGSLQGPVICPAFRAKQTGVYTLSVSGPLIKAKFLRSGFWGFNGIMGARINVSHQLHVQRCKKVHCSFSSSSNGNGSMAENFNENDEDYINSSVVEALEVKSGPDGFMIKMRDGRHLRCVHNNPQGGHLPDYAPHPAIVLKMEDGTGLLLPIIVLEMPSVLLMAAIRNVQIARPTMYQVVKEMVDKMGYAVKVVRVTKRVHEAYFAQLYLTKLGNETESVSFDLRPSDAINIAVICKRLPHAAAKLLSWPPPSPSPSPSPSPELSSHPHKQPKQPMLEAVHEIAIFIHPFHNLDLFQQGWYQIKITMRREDGDDTCLGTPARAVQYEGLVRCEEA